MRFASLGFTVLCVFATDAFGISRLPLPADVFVVNDQTAFVMRPEKPAAGHPWVWYAPTLHKNPHDSQRYYFQQLLARGIAVAGYDLGEVRGARQSSAKFTAFYDAMIARGYSSKPVLLGQSRGGLMMLCWAFRNPAKVGAFAGIYPVCNITSWPLQSSRASVLKDYGMTEDDLRSHLDRFNPPANLAGLAAERVPMFILHGDADRVVPYRDNGALIKEAYTKAGGDIQVRIVPGKGHQEIPAFFRDHELLAFLSKHAIASGQARGASGLETSRMDDSRQALPHVTGEMPMKQGHVSGTGITSLRCEYQVNPLGIDCEAPRLSWRLHSKARSMQQAAYQVLVASSRERLARNDGDLWDSGKVASNRTHLISYAGKPLVSHQQCFWKVGVWRTGQPEAVWSEAATWSMGILQASGGWRAKWIAIPEVGLARMAPPADAQWIWGVPAGVSANVLPPGECHLSRAFSLPHDAVVQDAVLRVSADNAATVQVNGVTVVTTTDWKQGRAVNVKEQLTAGKNTLQIMAVNSTNRPSPAGVICSLDVALARGQTIRIVSDQRWSATLGGASGAPSPATEIAPWGQGPWGEQTSFQEGTSQPQHGLPVFRKRFVIRDHVQRALVHVSGLGHYELFLNGEKVGDRFLDAPWSQYEKTAYYSTFDITDLLQSGENTFRIMLGKGFYNTQGDRRVHGVRNDGRLMAILQAHVAYSDGTADAVVTDEHWEAAHGPILHSAILAGSDYDARLAEPRRWGRAEPTQSPAVLRASESPAMKRFERLAPMKPADEPEPGVFVYDFGLNLSSIPRITVRGQAGQTVRLTPAEQRFGQTGRYNDGAGRVNQAGVGSPNYYEYTLSGQGSESWEPQFTYGGFQYLEVTGAVPSGHPNPKSLPVIEAVESVHVRADTEAVGGFACSHPLFMKIDTSIDNAVRSNLAHVLTDCPTREKLGWLEVSYLMGPSISRRYDLSRLYGKVTRDIRDAQGDDGVIYTVAPDYPKFKGGFRYTPEWGAAGVILPWQLYRWYGDQRVLRENLPAMIAFVDYLKATSNDLVPKAGLGDWYDYGHGKGNGPAKFTPPELSAMATFYRCTDILVKTAEVLGEAEVAADYRRLAAEIRHQFNAKFYVGNGQYQNHGSCQTANAMALVCGLVDPENEAAVLDAVVADLKARDYQQTAGDVGFHYLVEALGRYGRHDTLYKNLSRRDEGSYGFILDLGWTALPEAWDANTVASMNHCMLGHAQQWFYIDVLGIRQAEDSVGFQHIVIKPAAETDLIWAKGYYDAAPGRIDVDWKKAEGQFMLNLVIPANTTATVHLPAKDVASTRESGRAVSEAEGVTFLRAEHNSVVLKVGSGSYAFTSAIE